MIPATCDRQTGYSQVTVEIAGFAVWLTQKLAFLTGHPLYVNTMNLSPPAARTSPICPYHAPQHAPVIATLYTRQGCHLCDDAQEFLERHGLEVKTIDISGDPELVRRYGDCIPVVVIDGQERFRGRVDPVLLKRLIKSTGKRSY
jgi:glutaredoxin